MAVGDPSRFSVVKALVKPPEPVAHKKWLANSSFPNLTTDGAFRCFTGDSGAPSLPNVRMNAELSAELTEVNQAARHPSPHGAIDAQSEPMVEDRSSSITRRQEVFKVPLARDARRYFTTGGTTTVVIGCTLAPAGYA